MFEVNILISYNGIIMSNSPCVSRYINIFES